MNEVILVIEKDEAYLSAVSSALYAANYEVLEAYNVEEGVRKAREIYPDLIVVDLDSTTEAGLEKLKKIGSRKAGSPELLLLSEFGRDDMIMDFMGKGCSGYMFKPVREVELILFSVRSAIERRQLARKNRCLMSQLKQLAIKDLLTETFNYWHLHTRLSEEIIRARRYGRTFCIFIIDIDDFKSLNREFGHLAGDSVLIELRRILWANLRKVDSVFRYGGDEFAILLPDIHKELAMGIVIRLLSKIRNSRFFHDGHSHQITVSIGCAMFPDKAEDKDHLLTLAETALSRAKEAGGDTVCIE